MSITKRDGLFFGLGVLTWIGVALFMTSRIVARLSKSNG